MKVDPASLILARALEGKSEALQQVLRELPWEEVSRHRLGPALALEARRQGVPKDELGQGLEELHLTAGRSMLLSHRMREVAAVLGAEEIPWLPIKGMDLASRSYDVPEQRPTGDLDLLVHTDDLEGARRALQNAGWIGRGRGPRFERFLRTEAYCWQARYSDGTDLELHFRLWGMVPEPMAAAVLESSSPDSDLGPTARRPSLSDAYLLAAVHAWMDPPPRPILAWWDLQRIATLAPDTLGQEVVASAHRWQLQLPVVLAASQAAALWPSAAHGSIADGLEPHLRKAEGRELRKGRKYGMNHLDLRSLTIARVFARRPSRTGWRAPLRLVWAHPGVVERETPGHWPWPLRRTWFLARKLRWARVTDHIESKYLWEESTIPADTEES